MTPHPPKHKAKTIMNATAKYIVATPGPTDQATTAKRAKMMFITNATSITST
jgi:hypothetical protein